MLNYIINIVVVCRLWKFRKYFRNKNLYIILVGENIL